MLEAETYERRFKAQLVKRDIEMNDTELAKASEGFRLANIPPSIAATKCFGKMALMTNAANTALDPVIKLACKAFELNPEESATRESADWLDARSVICHISVNLLNIRPHSVIRKQLGFKRNSMVNHHLKRAKKRSDSITFSEKLKKVTSDLKIK